MTRVKVEEVGEQIVRLIEEANREGEIIITREDEPIAKLVPLASKERSPRFGSAKGLIQIADDFDAPLEDFREYME